METVSRNLLEIPRLPVLGWASFRGDRAAKLPGVLDLPNVRYTTSGRAAIALALRVLNVQPGDAVLVPTYHCPTMIAPIVRAGATPVFFPVDALGAPSRAFLDSLSTTGVRAMLAAHYFGLPQHFSWLREWCDRRGIALIEDCAHAFFGRSDGRPVGSWGDVAIASLTKFFPVPEGGCLVSAKRSLDHVELAPRGAVAEIKAAMDAFEMGARHARFAGLNGLLGLAFGAKDRLRGRSGPSEPPADEDVGEPSVNEYDDSLVAVRAASPTRWVVRHVKHARIVAQRRHNYVRLAALLADVPGARPLRPELPDGAAPYVFPLLVENAEPRYRALRSVRLPLFRWDRLWPGTPSIADDNGLHWASAVFQLACHQDLSDTEIERIAATVHDTFAKHAS